MLVLLMQGGCYTKHKIRVSQVIGYVVQACTLLGEARLERRIGRVGARTQTFITKAHGRDIELSYMAEQRLQGFACARAGCIAVQPQNTQAAVGGGLLR